MAPQGKDMDTQGTIRRLQQENENYRHLAETDWLTGLYNRGAMQQYVNAALKRRRQGNMIVFDLDYFKRVNDRFGHIVGDRVLQTLGDVLKKMIPRNCLIGRVGGDEFAIFCPEPCAPEEVEERCARIRGRFREIQLAGGVRIRMSMTIAWADGKGCRDYNELFDLADQKVVELKHQRGDGRSDSQAALGVELQAVNQDIRLIVRDLSEKDVDEGAYCQDYETFRRVFRLELRRMQRKDADVYLILFTLTDRDNHFIAIHKRDFEMELLGEEIRKNLRLGDVYTQYSSCQYLVMVPDVKEQYIDVIADRIRQAYYGRHEAPMEHVMLHKAYPLRPIAKDE